ncbi:Trp biosynthesis-associated membrane protein [Ruania albidiflava]|uniref:Trp biosynthesis-associated membrane protein n=1 Tax=Ruania albidiflava TaxID=366586 RepID=UPI0023F05D56|nr:Trp biosynthesis-associated membrane protein [Ruania albidiflava]
MSEPQPGRRRLSRRSAVLVVLGGGALLLASTALPWATAPARSAVATSTVSVTGSTGAALVPSAALVVLAAGLAMALAGRVARVVAALAVALGGGLAGVGVIELLGDPEPAVRAAVGQDTGMTELAGAAEVTAWPVVALVLAVLLLLVGVVLPFRMGAWDRVGQRYERDQASAPAAGSTRQRISDWDALSRGEDPSDPEDR